MKLDTTQAIKLVLAAQSPTDLFGPLTGGESDVLAAIKNRHRELAPLIHTDRVDPSQADEAKDAFARLTELRQAAEDAVAIANGHGPTPKSPEPTLVTGRKHEYIVSGPPTEAAIATVYACTYGADHQPGVLKLARRPLTNSLIRAEAETLGHLLTPDRPEAEGFFPLLPLLIESFPLHDGSGPPRQANVFKDTPGMFTLERIRQACPGGISPKHMAWIWRRLLDVLGYAHRRGVIHGAVLPTNVMVNYDHELVLTDWCYAVRHDPAGLGAHIPATSKSYAAWYPPEVNVKAEPTPSIDLMMSARCMIYLMGGNPGTGALPDSVDGVPITPQLAGFLQSCLLAPINQRPHDAWQLLDDFTQLIEQLWGKRCRIYLEMLKM